MADKAAPAAAPSAAQDVPNLQKDDVTGEMVSKSELKKRQKKRDADKRKVWLPRGCVRCKKSCADIFHHLQAEKASAAPVKPKVADKPADAESAKLNEEELTPNVCPPRSCPVPSAI